MLHDFVDLFLLYRCPGLDCPGVFLGGIAWGHTAERGSHGGSNGFHGREQQIEARSRYTLYVPLEQEADFRPVYGDYVQNADDGRTYRVVSDGGRKTPDCANLGLAAYSVVEAPLPELREEA